MNYPYSIPGSQTDPRIFTADNTHVLGRYRLQRDENTAINVDYSKLAVALNMTGYFFKVTPGGMPGLLVGGSRLQTTPSNALIFSMAGGIAGRTYVLEISVMTTIEGVRTDTLYVDVYDPADDGSCDNVSIPASLPASPVGTSGDGFTFTNTAPRYFISSTPPQGANVMDMWFNPNTGIIAVFASDGVKTWWQNLVVPQGQTVGPIIKLAPLTFSGTAKTYPLTAIGGAPVYPGNAEDLLISLDGVWQEAETAYTVNSSNITFAIAPAVDVYFFGVCFGTTG